MRRVGKWGGKQPINSDSVQSRRIVVTDGHTHVGVTDQCTPLVPHGTIYSLVCVPPPTHRRTGSGQNMTDCKVVYWPRHLWTSSTCASAAHVPSAVCQRLSQDALCVVSLELQEEEVSDGLEVLLSTTNVRAVRHVVLFDAHVAARGEFETLHSPHLMRQIGDRFSGSNKRETRAAVAPSGTSATITWLVETVGYYSLFVPFTALLVVTTASQRLVHDIHVPVWFPIGGGKSVAVGVGHARGDGDNDDV